MKKVLLLLITIATFVACLPLTVGADNSGIMPIYETVRYENSSFTIDEDGMGIIILGYEDFDANIASATITVKMQKKFLLFFWQDVDLGGADGEWSVTTTSSSYSNVITKQLSAGTHRVQIEYKIRSTDGTVETINREYEQKY